MINRVYISNLNPLNFTEYGITPLPQYNTKHMDQYQLSERLNHWQYGEYFQPWQNNDTIYLQFQNNIGQMQVEIIDCSGRVVPGHTFLLNQVSQNKLDADYFIYEGAISLVGLEPGKYFIIINIGSNPVKKIIISNPIEVMDIHDNTLLLEYTHPGYYQNMIFLTGIKPSIRVNGLHKLNTPLSKDTMFEDQILDIVMVKSKPFRTYTLYIFPVPDFMIDKLNEIVGCKSLKIDGKYFTKNEGAKWEEGINVENGTEISYRIELRESISRTSRVFDVEENVNEELVIMLNVDSKGFADTSNNASSNNVRIINVE